MFDFLKFKNNFGRFAKLFILVFLVIFVVSNIKLIKDIFNYKQVYGQIFAERFKSKETVQPEVKIQKTKSKKQVFHTEENNVLKIPKLGIEASIIFEQSSEKAVVEQALNKGVVHYALSALPGKEGNTVILGHSAPVNWAGLNYKSIFSKLNNLEAGDKIYVFYNHQKLTYTVAEKFFLEKGWDIPNDDNIETSNLNLITCWPPGKDIRRLVVSSVLL